MLLAALPAGQLAAAPGDEDAPVHGLSLGLGVEGNSAAIPGAEGPGLGALFALEGRLFRYFALDFRISASTLTSRFSNFGAKDSFVSLESLLYLRFYPFALEKTGQNRFDFFLGAGVGVITALDGMDFRDSHGSPEAGAIAGVRFPLGRRFYLEPYVRASFQPVLFGAGISAGFRIPLRTPPPVVIKEEKTVEVEVEKVVEVERIIELAAPSEVFVVAFPPNQADFSGFDEGRIARNEAVLTRVAQLLRENHSTRVLIEGFANPVLRTEDELAMLRRLREEQAAYITQALFTLGIPANRIVAFGENNNLLVPFEDTWNWERNRRVEMRLVWGHHTFE